jgi:hypothetical protein
MLCRTSPSWNIVAYNAIGGSGDELYGVESAGYYIRNLLLNTGLSFPLAVFSIVSTVIYFTNLRGEDAYLHGVAKFQLLTISCSALLWLIILFSRPHKVPNYYLSTNVLLTHVFCCRKKDLCIQFILFFLYWQPTVWALFSLP